MRIARVVRTALLICLCSVSPILAFAQNGTVAGTVVGPDGQPVPAAVVTLSGVDGVPRSITASAQGEFLLQGLASGSYTVKATGVGFAALEESAEAVAEGRTAHLLLRLALAGVQQTVDVTAPQTAFDTSQTSSVVNIDRDRVEELPIPSRNYLSFVLLSPQVMPANPALPHPGGTSNNGGFSFGGLRPGSNAVYLDGVNDDDEYSGGSRTQLSPEAISDFQIVNHGFAAEAGGGAGGSIDVQTRAGVNRVHDDAFVFEQNGALNATPPLERVARKPDESRLRAGVALGGPLQRDHTFYYVAAEQEIARGEDASDLSTTTLGMINAALKQYAPLSGLTLQPGFFPTTDEETELSGRVDRVLTSREALMLRYAMTNSRNVNDAFNTEDFADRTARGSSFVADNSLNGTLTSTLSDALLNSLSVELAQRRAVDKTGAASGPGIVIPGVAMFGTPWNGNDRRYETHLEFADTLSIQRGRNLFKLGARVDRIALRTSVPDASQGLFVFANLAALQARTPDFFTKSFGSPLTNFAETRFAAFAQDHWTASQRLTLDFGVRYEVNRMPAPIPQDSVNFSPRLGVAWTPWKTLVVRGGFGIFYDRPQLATISRVLEFDGTRGFAQIAEDSAAAAVYQGGAVVAAPLAGVAPSIWRAQSGLRNPYSEVASLGVEQALPMQTTLSAEYQFVRGVLLGRTSNVNLAPPVTVTAANAASLGIASPTAQQLGRPAFGSARLNPAFDAISQFSSSASSTYNGATVTLNRQFQDDLQIMAGYTYSKTMDDASYDGEQPQNPYDLRGERRLSLEDQRHRFTLSGLWLIGPDLGDPADAVKNANPGPLMKALTGFEFAPIVSLTTGFRANPVTGLDSNREHVFPFAARPAGYGRNSLSTAANFNVDLRVLRMVAIGGARLDIVAETFNLLNHRNVSLLNTAYGSDVQAAGGFGKPIATSDARRIQFSLDYEF